MKFLKAALVATALTGFVASAQAQDSNTYINIGVDAVEFDAYNVSAKIGYNFSENFGVEAQGAFGLIDDKITEDGDTFKVGIDSSFGGFLVGRVPAGESFDLLARVGYHFTQIGASEDSVGISLDTDGIAYGVGGQYWFNEMSGVRLEYTRYDLNVDSDLDIEDELDFGADVVSLSYVRNF